MTPNCKTISLIIILLLTLIAIPACAPAADSRADRVEASATLGEIPTWTPRPEDITPPPPATRSAPEPTASSTPQAGTDTPVPTATLKSVTFSVSGGNLNVRRGPGVAYNYVGVLYDGDTAKAVGRDRISRWLMIELPGTQEKKGWVTTETDYSVVSGDVSSLPFVKVEPASPAFIRNCTGHTILILPDYVQLLPLSEKPYNEDRFGVGFYEVYDVDVNNTRLEDIDLSEGRMVDILYDGDREKSKCE